MATSSPVRRRRRPEDARAEILEAADHALREAPLSALTVSAVMSRTTLSRKSFYVYFDDLDDLVLALVRPLRERADAALAEWRGAADPVAAGRAALAAAAEVYREHHAILEAVLRAPTDDRALLAARRALVAPLAERATALLLARGDEPGARTDQLAQALATMNVHALLDRAPGASDDELAVLVDALSVIWERVVLPASES